MLEGYSGRGLWRFLCHGDTNITMKDMPHDMPTPKTPRAIIQTFRKELRRTPPVFSVVLLRTLGGRQK